MHACLNWPIEIVHEKCQSALADFQLDLETITVNRRGIFTFHLHCFVCEDSFIVSKNMLELTTLAALQDQQYMGDEINALTPHVSTRPN